MRIKQIKRIREKLKNNQVSLGTWQQIPHGSISEILGQSKFDWVTLDLEHGSMSIHQLPDLCRAIELNGALPLARIAEAIPKDCKQALDSGAGGIIAPMIESAEQLRMVKDACSWPPNGTRGVGFSRANLFGKNFNEYLEEANNPLLIAQIENIKAVENLDEILEVKGLDALIIGPYDLSASMNIVAEFKNPSFIEVIGQIIKLCKDYQIPYGYHIVEPDIKILDKKIEEGYQFIAYSIDAVFLQFAISNSTLSH